MDYKTPHETERKLKEFWRIDELKFTGHYAINRQGKGYFTNIRKPDGSICFYPDDTKVTIPAANIDNLEFDKEYIINAFVAPRERREELGLEYLLYLDTKKKPPIINQQTPKQYVQKLYDQYQAAEGILKDSLSGAIKRLAVETNKKAETFIYEILQNADDYPDQNRKEVDIHFVIVDNYLVVLHNGQPFRENNVYAICSVATGDKEGDITKTGFKGIGFKSLFKHSNYVWIHSGAFSFRFDEVYHKSKGNETFWQLIPIWTELTDVDSVISLPAILESPVSIVIKPNGGIGKLREYEDIFGDIFQDERLLLFLRTIKSITFQGLKKSFSKQKSLLNWEISDLPEIVVPKDVQAQINTVIDKHTDDRIPEKFKDIELTRITFATGVSNSTIIPTKGAKLYVYLPTDLDFGLPFLINGDFIPDGSRDRLFWDLDWNKFLFRTTGFSFVEWLKTLYLKYKNSNSIKLIPDIDQLVSGERDGGKSEYLLLFKDGMLEGFKSVSFVPDTNGKLSLLEEMVYDSTDLLDFMEEDYFRMVTGILKPIVHSSYSRDGVIKDLITKFGLGELFKKENLISCVKSELFRKWLIIPQNNISFLRVLIDKGWLKTFKNEEIFLTRNHGLVSCNACYYDLGDDQSLLSWLEISVLNVEVHDSFEAGDLNLAIYSPINFVANDLLTNKNINEILSNPVNNLRFYQFLFKYYIDFPEKLFLRLGHLSLVNYDGRLIEAKDRKRVYLLNEELRQLLDNKALPESHIYLLDITRYSTGEITPEWKMFWLRLGIKEVLDSSLPVVIVEEFIKRKASLFSYYGIAESGVGREALLKGNQLFWLFLHKSLDYLQKTEDRKFREDVSQLPVYTNNLDSLSALKSCYLTKEYTGNDTIENLADRHSNLDIKFVSEAYCKESQVSSHQWASLFKDFCVKTDVKDLLSNYLIPEIHKISDEELISVTQLIFENRAFLEDQLKGLKLKIKTEVGSWLPVTSAVIGTHYTRSSLIDDILPLIKIDCTISNEYSIKHLQHWAEFFKKLGAKELQSESEVISTKIDFELKGGSETKYGDKEFALDLIKDFVRLHIGNSLSNEDYKKLGSLNILLKHNEDYNSYAEACQCHYSEEYKPKLELDIINTEELRPILFVSQKYIGRSGDLIELKSFFSSIGVKDDFFIIKESNRKRVNLDSVYIEYIDTVDRRIKSNASGSFSYQHEVYPWKDMPYKIFLEFPKIAFLFWNRVLSQDNYSKEVFGSLTYKFYYGPIQILNPIEWFIRNTPSIPAKDGKCYKPSELYSLRLVKYIEDNSLIPAIDLSKGTYADKDLEEYLGLKMNLSLEICLRRFERFKDLASLKRDRIAQRVINILNENKLSEEESECLKHFVISGSLPNQIGEWRALGELYFIKDDFDLGVGNSNHLVHDDFKEVAHLLSIAGLSRLDFNPKFLGTHVEDFKHLLLDRLKFIALIKSSEAWQEESNNLLEIIKGLNFYTTKRIKLSYDKVEPAIENTDKNFFVDGKNIYYIGNWRWARAAELFGYLHESFGLNNISIKVLQDILLLEKNELFELLDEKKIQYPVEWRPSKQKEKKTEMATFDTLEEPDVSYGEKADYGLRKKQDAVREFASDLTEDEVVELESLLSRYISSDEMANTWIVALFRALKHYEVNGYNVTFAKSNIEEAFERRMLEGVFEDNQLQSKRVIVRSAKSGILRLNYQAWIDLNDSNTELFVVTGSAASDFLIFHDQQSLALHGDDSWVAKIGGDDKYLELNSLINGDYLSPDKKFAPFQLLIRLRSSEEYQSIFERIYNSERNASFNDLD